MQFTVGGAFGHQAFWGHLALGLAWGAAFAASGLIIFQLKTRTRRHAARATTDPESAAGPWPR